MKISRQDPETEISELAGATVAALKVTDDRALIFWMKTDTSNWYRFFVDAGALFWRTYEQSEIDEIMEEDFDGVDSRDLKQELNLWSERIISIQMNGIEINGESWGQLQIKFENNKALIVRESVKQSVGELILEI